MGSTGDQGIAQGLSGRAMELARTGNIDEGLQLVADAIRSTPEQAVLHRTLGDLLIAQVRLPEAALAYEEAVRRAPGDARAWLTLSTLYRRTGNPSRALECAKESLVADCHSAAAWIECGVLMRMQGDRDGAIACYRQAVACDPHSMRARFNLANAAREVGNFQEAADLYREVLEREPENADAWNNLGFALHQLDRLGEALHCYHRAATLKPRVAGTYVNIGNILIEHREVAAAIEAYTASLRIDPGQAEAHHSLGLAYLTQGTFDLGWREFEWRLKCRDAGGRIGAREFPRPQWDGSSLHGKRILVYAEQGLGDTIQFARLLPELARAKNGRVLFACYPHLIPLLRSLQGVEEIVDLTSPTLPGFDTYTALMSLPYHLGLRADTIPATIPYLQAPVDPEKVHAPMLKAEGFSIGLVWASNTNNRIARLKSLTLAELLPLARVEGTHWYSLQIGEAAEEAALHQHRFPLEPVNRDVSTMEATAAIIQQLDLTITVDTSIAHLAGALGKPVWVLLPAFSDWRWMLDRTDTPWYPTMRLFRQTAARDWSGILTILVDELTRTVAAHRRDTRKAG